MTAAERFYLALCLAYLERFDLPRDGDEALAQEAECQRLARTYWPLAWYQSKGIPTGRQWHILGWLAARYARGFGPARLAEELWEVMAASPQDPRQPWTRADAAGIAHRAARFIERADAQEQATYQAFVRGLAPGGGRRQRIPGSRVPGRRAS